LKKKKKQRRGRKEEKKGKKGKKGKKDNTHPPAFQCPNILKCMVIVAFSLIRPK
jgi:hypothetical protein